MKQASVSSTDQGGGKRRASDTTRDSGPSGSPVIVHERRRNDRAHEVDRRRLVHELADELAVDQGAPDSIVVLLDDGDRAVIAEASPALGGAHGLS